MEYQAEGLYVLTIASMCRRVKISNKTASKNIELLKEHNFLSKEIFEDEYGKYHKLYNLDDNIFNFVELSIYNELLEKILKTLNNKQIQFLIHYKINSMEKLYYHSTYNILSNKLGVSASIVSKNNELLIEMELIEVKKVLLSNGKYGNIYRCLI